MSTTDPTALAGLIAAAISDAFAAHHAELCDSIVGVQSRLDAIDARIVTVQASLVTMQTSLDTANAHLDQIEDNTGLL